MFDSRTVAAGYGLTVELTDLGACGPATLISEYDARLRVIRINERALEAYRAGCGELDSCALRAFIDVAIAHELYHYRESTGEIPRRATRAEREKAADAFARANVAVDARLDTFLRAAATS